MRRLPSSRKPAALPGRNISEVIANNHFTMGPSIRDLCENLNATPKSIELSPNVQEVEVPFRRHLLHRFLLNLKALFQVGNQSHGRHRVDLNVIAHSSSLMGTRPETNDSEEDL